MSLEDFTIITEAAKSKESADKVYNSLIKGFQHMIKWKIQPERQGSSWVKSINDARNEIDKEFDLYGNNGNFKNIVYADTFDQLAFDNAKAYVEKEFNRVADSDYKNELLQKLNGYQRVINFYTLDNFRNKNKIEIFLQVNATDDGKKYINLKEANELSMYDLLERRKNNF